MWIYDYKTEREYLAKSPRKKFYFYSAIKIEPVPGRSCTILVRKGMEEGRKPTKIFKQLNMFAEDFNYLITKEV